MPPPTIPLLCSVCPKEPKFSDQSHLLTHIASKGHLSHYYKVKVRSSHDPEAKRIIDEYDRWYAEWHVEDLMSDRMSSKDKKRTRPRLSNSNRPREQSTAPGDQLRRKAVNALDPRLAAQMVKHEPSPTPPPSFHSTGTGSPASQHSFASRVHTYNPFAFINGYIDTPAKSPASEYFDRPTTPFPRAPTARPVPHHTSLLTAGGEGQHDDTTVSECSKLKGVYWPGMDIFDSATPEMKRKRNQKKDISVLEQLELNSQEVEATELIFTPFGSFKKQRRISGSVTDSSPMKPDSSPRMPYLNRAALEDLDVNQARRRRRNVSQTTMFMDHGPAAYDDDQLELALTLGPRRKRNIDIFRDEEVSFTRPANMSLLTAEYHPPPQTDAHANPAFDFRAFDDPFQTNTYNGVGFDVYQQPPSYFSNGFSYHNPQPFQPSIQPEAPSFFANSFQPAASNSAFLPTFQQQPEVEYDDQRTITAPPSERSHST